MSHYVRGLGYLALASAASLYLGGLAFCVFWVWLIYGNHRIERAVKAGHIRQGGFDAYVVGSMLWPLVIYQIRQGGTGNA